MDNRFLYDVFLAHSIKDKEIVRDIAERLRADGIRVWFDVWEVDVDEDPAPKLEEGLECSQALVLCMSVNAFGADWPQLESYTFRFRDPLKPDRRLIPLRLDATEVKNSLDKFDYISWLAEDQGLSYKKLLKACQPTPVDAGNQDGIAIMHTGKEVFSFGHADSVNSVAFSPDGAYALSGSQDGTIRLWEVKTGQCAQVIEIDVTEDGIFSVAWSADGIYACTGSDDGLVRLWHVETGRCIRVMEGHSDGVNSVAFNKEGTFVLSGSDDCTIRLWQVKTGRCLYVLKGHTSSVTSVCWSPDGDYALSGSCDKTLRLWQAKQGRCLRVLKGHTDIVMCVSWSPDGMYLLSGSIDRTMRLWQVKTAQCIRVMEGHTNSVHSVAFSSDGLQALSSSGDDTLRLWQVETGESIRIMKEHLTEIRCVSWSPGSEYALTGAFDGRLHLWQVKTGKCIREIGGYDGRIYDIAWSADKEYVLSGSSDFNLRLWKVRTRQCLRVFDGHEDEIICIAWSDDGKHIVSTSEDDTTLLWNVETGNCIRILEEYDGNIYSIAWRADSKHILSGSRQGTLYLWQVKTGRCIMKLEGHTGAVKHIAWSPNGIYALTASDDDTIRLWLVMSGVCIRVLNEHTRDVSSIAWCPYGVHALTGSDDYTVRLWQIKTGKCIRVLEGHTDTINSIAWSEDGEYALTASDDSTVRLWRIESGRCLCVLQGHGGSVCSVAWSIDGRSAWSIGINGVGRLWDLSAVIEKKQMQATFRVTDQHQYTNAKVLLVGDTGVGKTGLSNLLALGLKDEEKNASTDGAWATHWVLPHAINQDGVEREIWLWDFAGQVDYRLVHQLFMDETAAAVLVFNPQQENPFEGLGQWDRDLQKASRHSFARLLVAGRIDRGGLVVSNSSMEKFMQERGFHGPLHITSAKTGQGCHELRDAIVNAIDWQNIPTTTTPARYHRMKKEILLLRDKGIVLISLAELKQRMDMALTEERFTLEELKAVIGLLSGPGMIQRLDFGNLVLLKPEVLSRYAAALVRQVRKHSQELGCIKEEDLLAGKLDYQDFERLTPDDEEKVLRVLNETMVKRAWCLRQQCDGVTLLTFPNYFRRERPVQPSHPNVMVVYRFSGPIDDIYTTLVLRLHYTETFEIDQLWKDSADFKTQIGNGLGLKLIREAEGTARIEVYFNSDVDENSRLVFQRYVHNHLKKFDVNFKRLRLYYCSDKKCDGRDQPFKDRELIDRALGEGGKGKVFCPACGKPIVLRDKMELKFESVEIREKTYREETESKIKLDNESLELILVGHTCTLTAEAGQIYRGYTNSDHGIDGEIEFKDSQGHATGKKLYMQLKSGDSYLKKRKRDGADIFQIKNERWVNYWQQQAYPVMLVIRNSKGEIRWMDVSEHLRKNKSTTQIVFTGESFDVMNIRKWRDKLLNK